MKNQPRTLPAASVRLAGQNIVLREWDEADIPALIEMYDDPEIDRWTPVPSPFDEDAARAYFGRARAARAEGRLIQLAITADGGQPQGEVLIWWDDPDDRDIELAYGVGSRFRRRGLASAAVTVATGYALQHCEARRVLLRIEAGNAPSAAVARSAGFAPTTDELVEREAKGRRVLLRTWCHGNGEPAP
ncbi:GNAT family N-acetyltransferase [Streptomyces sp. NBC_01005]|uniref:GNAT family N-acetyltransferase n=1 Tax=unclassified Streptomyces TaxID=2593676 RepID=UPI002E34E6D1|nr:GNAT family N-acetyltransferase [Streptomyces sp. NBC_01362]WSW03961.1 GNAT family N-acetyltransferase [Streptomyces sp. NBC_01005]WTC93466.1 GNAT family N-acetyltransferase [Streptomyces sp. NBC_01650]